MTKIILTLLLLLTMAGSFAQQISVNRIEQMPNLPEPYAMRNWKKGAMGYDSLVFDFAQSGEYLPLIHWKNNTINYPEHNTFVLHTVVGSSDNSSAEAINVLPAVISASLVGIDKSDQNGYNWVLACEEFFNRRDAENIYLNNYIGRSGSDWWYDTMPNVFFYQLYDLYPNTGDFEYQFVKVADRWLEAVQHMGGSTTPWKKASMNYRAWALSTMQPLTSGVKQPEAAGAIGWLLYNAYTVTRDEKYRIGAEWCLEFLNGLGANPAYELQLPYGVYIAARMNAELGTNYNVEKMLNWCFDADNNVRDWGATLGRWGEYDCDGLIGEAKYAGYAFTMNGFEQVGALVPLVRYDDRFARAIGKWVLNCANASRLYYSKYLPDDHQDNEIWSQQYDPNSYIAYEAIREFALYTGTSPYATGDFMRSNWGPTNLTLYGSSHVGILGGIIDTTNVERILKLDVLKTDYFQKETYPTYLYFNPYAEEKSVEINLEETVDLYDALSNEFVARTVSGRTSFRLPADEAMLIVLVPSGGHIEYDLEKMLVADIIVDYNSGQVVSNYPPRIKALAADDSVAATASQISVYCAAYDRDGDDIIFDWYINDERVGITGPRIVWNTPEQEGEYIIRCIANDKNAGLDTARIIIKLVESINHVPEIIEIKPEANKVDVGSAVSFTCVANDPDSDELSFIWTSEFGDIQSSESTAVWIAPDMPGYYIIHCTIDDNRGGQAADSVGLFVLDFDHPGMGLPIAFYPFNGNADDESGFDQHGTHFGPTPVADRFGTENAAFSFDGKDDFIRITNSPLLNVQTEISASFWFLINDYVDHEVYPISHGNWENRWKVSISPNSHTLRWTIKTDDGIKDLDSKIQIEKNRYYHATVLYDGKRVAIYIDGELDGQAAFSGHILPTDIDLVMGRPLPDNTCCNFNGVLDDVRIYSYALLEKEIQNIADETTCVDKNTDSIFLNTYTLQQNYPNPFNMNTTIVYQLKEDGYTSIDIFNLLGKKVRSLVDDEKAAGVHQVRWDGRSESGEPAGSGVYLYKMKTNDFMAIKKLMLLK
ncbi:T9SS type A sorting domain-containing protein [candidate division KSB1 bacterium]|nr:T9SS type A sorting domain-containing protein [candidate division KSB1 bacterium]